MLHADYTHWPELPEAVVSQIQRFTKSEWEIQYSVR